MDSNYKCKRPKHPRANANVFEIITYSWMLDLFKIVLKRDIEINDLYIPLNEHTSSTLGNDLEKKWRLELTVANNGKRKPSLLKALYMLFGTKIMFQGLILATSEIIFKMFQPILIGRLLLYFNTEGQKTTDVEQAYMYAACLTISTLVSMVLYHVPQVNMIHYGMKMRIACCSIIFRKAMRLSNTSLGETSVGRVVNLLSNDVNRFDKALFFLHFLWISPLQTIVVSYFLWQEIGVSSIFGVATLIMFIPLQVWFGKKISILRLKTAIRTDERVHLMNQIISGIQVIKMYTWEKPFEYLVQYARKMEIKQIRGSSYITAVFVSFMVFHSRVALFFSILAYVVFGNYITAQKVFVMASYFNILRVSLTVFFPQAIAQIAELLMTIKRIQTFLSYEEKNCKVVNLSKSENVTTNNGVQKPTINSASITTNTDSETMLSNYLRIDISNATAKWTQNETEYCLRHINLTVSSGQLVAIIGPVGAGKSSLMQAILRELPLSEGKITVNGVVSYASQEPWLFVGSVKKNILFGSPMDEHRYKQVIQVCALKSDFQQFPYGDETIVGERGVTLSGGQRARINLARAVYKQADIYLLDDPLSAVDTHVGSHLFEKCIKGFLKDKTCILITHQLQYLTSVEKIVLIENANIKSESTYEELQTSNLEFAKLLHSSLEMISKTHNTLNVENKSELQLIVDRQVSETSVRSPPVDESKSHQNKLKPTEVAETRTLGNISHTVYMSYFSAGGRKCKILFFILVCIFTQVLSSFGDSWISYWVNLEEHVFRNVLRVADNKLIWWSMSRQTCINVFSATIVIMIITVVIRSVLFVSVCMKASMTLHNNMFKALTKATIYFFNTNPSGRILNRFSKDIGTIDDLLPLTLMDCIQNGLAALGVFIVVGIVNVYMTVAAFVLGYIVYKIMIYYLLLSRSVKRLEGITRSPVFTHLNATLQGLTTIRAFDAEQILTSEFDNHQDLHSSAWYLFISLSRGFAFWLDIICLLYVSAITFSFVAIGNGVFGGNVGLAISQAFALQGMLQWGMRQMAELENNMTAVERVLEYTNVTQEDAIQSTDNKESPKWPSEGQIIFKNFYLRYGPDTAYVLNNININIESMQKVGIVGRTGAGKSSLISALFRLAFNEGNIIIDGIEIHGLELNKLRSKLSIIPQEPVLFSGTVRKNLDPFDEYPDHILWNALEEVELKNVIEELPNALDSKMSENGSNFSVGQRQLICLARAIVRNNKILVLDEATANVDPQTDALIQMTIRSKFRTCTVLTIAHRLNTVMDSDKVLVMDKGKMVEFDHPHNLLQNKEGVFYKMVEQTGPATSDVLHRIAEESYRALSLGTEPASESFVNEADGISTKHV
ncbi:ATP-binding cassette sub-family C member 4-like isoform X2 [Metopolophium dirhodum]|uniref:ATP-binding cassette sub-family C member 4-like isoform X2 n=1 Tax=Metopolophium dirhodum TaxID=44670 RepID=UPI00298F9462|nr:ATP-binding cassette sub-family C member 4-like isoform X2 [Metopolophium dirhodum]